MEKIQNAVTILWYLNKFEPNKAECPSFLPCFLKELAGKLKNVTKKDFYRSQWMMNQIESQKKHKSIQPILTLQILAKICPKGDFYVEKHLVICLLFIAYFLMECNDNMSFFIIANLDTCINLFKRYWAGAFSWILLGQKYLFFCCL